ncbi:SDR family NAD(P)-dependent oxidoreductase [uncultured Microbacterium sp.]|uniref:SDR family NAD(P)-dependent oxidoreductase n=1 Tax=uncultured Microbacterium sp. TaxID=191216 RepID=UPI0035C98772
MTGRHAAKAAVVTGAAQGIGLATCHLLIAEGARVVAVDVNPEALDAAVAELGDAATGVVADVSSETDCARAVDACVEAYGQIDIMIAHAGIAIPQNFLSMTSENFRAHLDVNVVGAAMCAVYAARSMKVRATAGSIVITASINGTHVEESMAAYNVSKGALLTLIRSAALDLAGDGIRVNGVAPGVIRTAIAAPVFDDPATTERYLESIPVGRFGEPDDVASVISWLASAESSYVVGQTIVVDGGQTLGIRGSLEVTQ